MQRFGEKLRTLRERRGMTLHELALALGLTNRSHISNLEAGRKKPSLELIIKIALFFEVTTDQLLLDDLEVD
jgi:transcriptional regulator with XRE-family HTH domain